MCWQSFLFRASCIISEPVINFQNCCCSCSVTKSCSTLCDPMDCSMAGFPVLHCLLEFTQTHVHWVNDVIQPPPPLSPLLFLPSIIPSIRIFSNESTLHIKWPEYKFTISFCGENLRSGLLASLTNILQYHWLYTLCCALDLQNLLIS